MSEKPPTFETGQEKILTREEILAKLIEYAGTSEYEIVGEGKDPKGLNLLEIEVKDPGSNGYFLLTYARKKETDVYGRGSLDTVIHYATRDADHYEDGGGSNIAKYVDGEWVKADNNAPWIM